KNFILKVSATMLILLMPCVVMAQKGQTFNVKGNVNDESDHSPIAYATVFIENTNLATITDENGNFEIKNIPNGEKEIIISYVGYGEYRQKVSSNKDLHIHLEKNGLNVDEVVVTANRYATKKREAVSIVSTVSPKLFEQTGAVTPAEVLSFQTGTRVEYNCGNCGYPQLRINGLEGQYSQVLIDSRAIMSSLTSVYGLEILPSSMIERVEVLKGGGSAIFGSNAIGGVVNIITKEPGRNSIEISNQTSVYEGGGTDVNTVFNGAFATNDSRTGIFLFGSVRNRDYYDRNGDGFSEMPLLESQAVGFRAYQKIKERSKITLEYHHLTEFRRGGNEFDLVAHQADIAEQLDHSIDGGGLTYDYSTKNEKGSLSVYGSFQNSNRDSYYGAGQDLYAYGKTKDLVLVGGAQFDYSVDKLLFMPSILTVGIEGNANNIEDAMPGYDRYLDQKTKIVGGYFQNEWRNEKLSILAGVRVDKHNMLDDVVASPRISARYAPSKEFTLRGSYSTGFRAPQAYDEDLHIEAVGGAVAIVNISDDLNPERSQSINASLDYYKMFDKLQFNLLAEGFYTDINDVFILTDMGEGDDGNTYFLKENAAGAVVKGLNLESRVAFGSDLSFQAGYTFQKSLYDEEEQWSDDVEGQREMFRSPDHYGYITASGDPFKDFNIALTANFTGKMYIQHCAGYIDTDRTELTEAMVDLGLRFSYKLRIADKVDLELSTGIKNMLNTFQNSLDEGPDKDAGYIYGPTMPRTYYFGAKISIF
ncbi:MAG: TonB-dependent receptor, partial [Rikenellaceae bacterium]